MIYKLPAEKHKKQHLTSAFWCPLYSCRSTDLLTEKVHLAFHHGAGTLLEGDQRQRQKPDLLATQLPDQGPAMTEQQNEKPEKLKVSSADPAGGKWLAGVAAAGCVLSSVSLGVVEVVAVVAAVAAAAVAAAAAESAYGAFLCSQFHS